MMSKHWDPDDAYDRARDEWMIKSTQLVKCKKQRYQGQFLTGCYWETTDGEGFASKADAEEHQYQLLRSGDPSCVWKKIQH